MNDPRKVSRIEGGIDAVVIGGTPDALAAAALLARTGLHVVIVDDKPNDDSGRHEFAAGYFTVTGDPIATHVDTRLIEALDLYRHGLSYSARRLETLARFHDGAVLRTPGDPALLAEAIAEFSEPDAESFTSWHEEERALARRLRGWFAGDEAAPKDGALAERLSSSFDGMLVGCFADARIDDYLRAEAALGGASLSSDPYSYLALLGRLSGEISGLQGAFAYVDGGGAGIERSLRRACDVYGVSIRSTAPVKSVIIEWDRVAGVDFADGSQIRTPIIVTARPAGEAFLRHVGRDKLDLEFTRLLDIAPPKAASMRAHLALNGPVANAQIASRLDHRILLAPSAHQTEKEFRTARNGDAPQHPIAELVFPSAFDASLAPEGCSTAVLTIHPVAGGALGDEERRKTIEESVKRIFLGAVGGADIVGMFLEEPEPARPALAAAIEQRDRLCDAGGLEGYFFCGAEALIGRGSDLSAGRRAGESARDYFKKGG